MDIGRKEIFIALAVFNFFIPFAAILRNKTISKEEKIKRMVRAALIMGLISGLSILFFLWRYGVD